MRHYWIRGGHMNLGLQVSMKVLSRMPPAQRTADRARALFDVGQLNYFTGNFAQARRYLEDAWRSHARSATGSGPNTRCSRSAWRASASATSTRAASTSRKRSRFRPS
jgi:hypothetical protein